MKDTTLNKKVKKAEFTVSSRKMKGKSVLYVKARAYKVVDGKTEGVTIFLPCPH